MRQKSWQNAHPYSGDSGKAAQSSTNQAVFKMLKHTLCEGKEGPTTKSNQGPLTLKMPFCFICLLLPGADHRFSRKHPSVQTLPENQSLALQLSHIFPITVATALRVVAHPKDRFSFYKIKAISVPNLLPVFQFCFTWQTHLPKKASRLNLLKPTVGPTQTEISTTMQLSDLQMNCFNSTTADIGQQPVSSSSWFFQGFTPFLTKKTKKQHKSIHHPPWVTTAFHHRLW